MSSSDKNTSTMAGNIIHPDPNLSTEFQNSSSFSNIMSPWNHPCTTNSSSHHLQNSLIGQEGHIYSLAVRDDTLYTGSHSNNIRVYKNMKEFSVFKANSGLVKAIIIFGGNIFTGHQDGKIRVWKISPNNATVYKLSSTMPTFFDVFKASIKPGNYVEVRRNRSKVWIQHADAISCLSMDKQTGILYSSSWDKTFKAWWPGNSKCMESVKAHDDAVNSLVASGGGMVYTGSADGTVKAWKREQKGRSCKHTLVKTLLKQESAVTALAVNESGTVVYSGSSDGVVNFWEAEKQLAHGGVLKGHKLAVLCVAAAGRIVLSGSADKTICVWRREGEGGHSWVSVLRGHTGPVKCLAVEKEKEETDRKWVVYSGSLDRSVKVWNVSEMAPEHIQKWEL